jgi:hypothetical protein
MKKIMRLCLSTVFLTLSFGLFFTVRAEVTLEVLNPLGEVEPEPTLGISPRISDLKGKTVALMDNWKTGGVYLQDRFEELLKKQFPGVKVLRTTKPQGKEGGGRLIYSADPWYPEVANSADAFIYTIAD